MPDVRTGGIQSKDAYTRDTLIEYLTNYKELGLSAFKTTIIERKFSWKKLGNHVIFFIILTIHFGMVIKVLIDNNRERDRVSDSMVCHQAEIVIFLVS